MVSRLIMIAHPLRLVAICLLFFQTFAHAENGGVSPVSPALREKFDLGEHYQKAVLVGEFPIVSSQKVPDAALLEAAHIVRSMLAGRDDILDKLAENRVRMGVMAVSERTTDLPEHATLKPAAYWDRRARGLGASPQRPCISCAEENLLNNPGDPYDSESITVHEFAHAIHDMALVDLDKTFDERLEKTYRKALADGLWKGKYAATNRQEYWAEAVQSWFGTNRENDHDHNHVNTRAELKEYDPGAAALCKEVFGDNQWQYRRADDPARANEAHLKNLDRSKLKPLAWTEKEESDYRALQNEKK